MNINIEEDLREQDSDKFEDYISELRSLYYENPKEVLFETRNTVKKLKETNVGRKNVLSDINTEILGICVLAILIAVMGIFNLSTFTMYLFGFVFFISGLLVGLKTDTAGIIFLFSHGVTGMCLMIGSQIGGFLASPAVNDASVGTYLYLGIGLVLIVISIIYSILYNLSSNLKTRKNAILVPLFLFAIVFAMSVAFTKIFGYDGTVNIFN